jgi:hypothetical protein
MRPIWQVNGFDDATVHAFNVALRKYGSRPDVTGVDIGIKVKDGELNARAGAVIRIHVREKIEKAALTRREKIPASVEGIPTDIIEARYVEQHAAMDIDPARVMRVDPFQPGVSIGHEDSTAGTLGMFVTDTLNMRRCILSTDHVLRGGSKPKPGDAIVQPGPADEGATPGDVVATLGRFNKLVAAAIAPLTGARQLVDEQLGSGVRIANFRLPIVGDVLEKSGRTTGITQGLVDGLGHFDGVGFSMHLRPLAEDIDDIPISDGGDSGAVWYDPETRAGVGLHVRGAEHPTGQSSFAIASSLVVIAQKLNIRV